MFESQCHEGVSTFVSSEAVRRVRATSLRPAASIARTDVIALNRGEPDFATPDVVIDAMIEALREGYTHYGPIGGDPDLRALIARQASQLAGDRIDPKSVSISHGGTAAVTASVMAVVDRGDRVVIPEPTYSLYFDAVRLAGGEVVHVAHGPDHHLDLDTIVDRAAGAKLLVLCNPVNPTGAVLMAAELAELGGRLDKSTLVMVDETYADLVYTGEPFTSALAIPKLRHRLVYVQTLSKTYAMTGWRIGYVIAPSGVAADVQLVHRTLNCTVNTAVQRAALAALTAGPRLAAPMLAEYRRRRDFVVDRIARMANAEAVVPDGAFYVFVKYGADLPAGEVAQRLLDGGVAVRAGSEFGPSGEGHIRLSFTTELPALAEGLDRLERVFASL
jgi:aspartate aminotransferase